jgi:hypothetical protein
MGCVFTANTNDIDERRRGKMAPNRHRKLRVRIFVEERNEGMDWVPYKTLIGYNVANRPTLGRLWEAVYYVKEFASKAEAL